MIHGEVHDAEPALADAPGDLEFAEARTDLKRDAVFAGQRLRFGGPAGRNDGGRAGRRRARGSDDGAVVVLLLAHRDAVACRCCHGIVGCASMARDGSCRSSVAGDGMRPFDWGSISASPG
jgi:hypothetical protein